MSSAPAFLAGGGEMGESMRTHRGVWRTLGEPDIWPQTLRIAVSIMLNSYHPVFITWGVERVLLYNDACIPIVGAKHPAALGQSVTQICSKDGLGIAPLVQRAANGEPASAEELRLITQRAGYPEESWFTVSCSPLREDDGRVVGVFGTCMESTANRIAQRRMNLQLRLGERLSQLSDPDNIRKVAAQELGLALDAARVGYAINAADAATSAAQEWSTADALDRPIDWELFGPILLDDLQAGTALRVYDWSTDLRTRASQGVFAPVGVMLVPLLQQGKLFAVLYVCADRPRHWSDVELSLAEDVALRGRLATQRARAVQARRLAEDALKQQLMAESDRLRGLFALAPSFMAVLRGPRHVFELINDALIRLVGRSDLVGKPVREALPELEGQQIIELLDEVYASGEPRVAEEFSLRVTQPVPKQRFISFVYQPLFAAEGSVQGVFVVGHDVTGQRVAHEALREQEARLRLALRAARMAEITIRYADNKVTHSESCAEMFGYSAGERLTVEHLRARYHPDDAPVILRRRDELWASGKSFLATTHRIVWPDGSTHWLSVRGEIERSASGQPVSITAVYIDITEQQRAMQALRQSEEQFRVFAQVMPNHVWVADARGKVQWLNDKFYEYAGESRPENPTHELWEHVVHPDDVAQAMERWVPAMKTGCVFETDMRLRRRDGEYRWFIGRALPIRNQNGEVTRWIGSLTDIHDQKVTAGQLEALNATLEIRVEERSRELRAAEQALRHAQKMEAVGQLTGGIAHDFNNLLTGIIGGIELVQRRMVSGRMDDAERFMSAALTSANRAAALTQRLLAFSRQQQLHAEPLQLNDLIRSMADLLNRTLAENITLDLQLDPQLWLTEADRNQLESALLNVTINSRDAMPVGGRMSVRTCNLRLHAQDAQPHSELEPGDYVLLEINDTGKGMSPEVLERAFDPFFTTKPVGQGTGLGLSMIYGFAKQSRGHVHLESGLGSGTTFSLYLPRFAGTLPEVEAPAPKEMPLAQNGETVVIVEDEAAVRMLVVDVLEEMGYRFIEAADSAAAVPILESEQSVDLLITDVGLPGMSGRELAQLARKQRPELKVLFITGYADDAIERQWQPAPGMELMRKPFALEQLARKIREMLQQDS
ncbi:MAG: PAS domain-containing protein [Steroidobacteraceae bacterium]